MTVIETRPEKEIKSLSPDIFYLALMGRESQNFGQQQPYQIP